jgi:hypothetical protein
MQDFNGNLFFIRPPTYANEQRNLDVTTSLSAPNTFINSPKPSMTPGTGSRELYLSRKITRADRNKIPLDVFQEM